jgi:hypothetical protein
MIHPFKLVHHPSSFALDCGAKNSENKMEISSRGVWDCSLHPKTRFDSRFEIPLYYLTKPLYYAVLVSVISNTLKRSQKVYPACLQDRETNVT